MKTESVVIDGFSKIRPFQYSYTASGGGTTLDPEFRQTSVLNILKLLGNFFIQGGNLAIPLVNRVFFGRPLDQILSLTIDDDILLPGYATYSKAQEQKKVPPSPKLDALGFEPLPTDLAGPDAVAGDL